MFQHMFSVSDLLGLLVFYFGCNSLCVAAFTILVLRNIMQGLNALKDDGDRVIEEMILALVMTPQTALFIHILT